MKIGSFSEILLRLETINQNSLINQNQFEFSFVGTGVNFLTTINKHNINAYLISKLPNNSIGKNAKEQIHKYNINTSYLMYEGDNIGIYVLEKGAFPYPSVVTYLNRKNSEFNQLKNFDFHSIIDSLDALHFCGISLQTMQDNGELLLAIANYAKQQNKIIIFDYNVRKSLANSIEQEKLIKAYQKLTSYATVLSVSLWDIQNILTLPCNSLEEGYNLIFEKYPNIKLISTLNRKEKNNQQFIFGTCQAQNSAIKTSVEIGIQNVIDRIGTGDAYLGYLIGSYFKNDFKISQEQLDKAIKYCHLSHFKNGDVFNLDLEEFQKILENANTVIR